MRAPSAIVLLLVSAAWMPGAAVRKTRGGRGDGSLCPKVGFGTEVVFQVGRQGDRGHAGDPSLRSPTLSWQGVNGSALNHLLQGSGSRLQRFPGGTPSGIWDWKKGFEISPYHDKTLTTFCPTSPSQSAELV